jgi:hypothetical protein
LIRRRIRSIIPLVEVAASSHRTLQAAGEVLLGLYYALFGALTVICGLVFIVAASRTVALPVGLSAIAGALMVALGGGFAHSRTGRARRRAGFALIVGGVVGGGPDGWLATAFSSNGSSFGDYLSAYLAGVLWFGSIAIISGLVFLGPFRRRIANPLL